MENKRALVIRYGAIGDMMIVTTFLRYLHKEGWEIFLNTSEEGMEILKHCPWITKLIYHPKNSVPTNKLYEHWAKLKEEHKPTRIFNLTESYEVNIVYHPSSPIYMMPKSIRGKIEKNCYEAVFEYLHINPNGIDLTPELHFKKQEIDSMEEFFKGDKDKFKIYLPISGSGINKIYPYWPEIMNDVFKVHKDMILFTVGDVLCELIEYQWNVPYMVPKSARWSIREAMLASKYCDLVVATDTGMLHAAGAWDVPKIILFGHNTPEVISKHFKGEVTTMESTVNCAPCHRLIYDSQLQCPRSEMLGAGCLCMTGIWRNGECKYGLDPVLVRRLVLDKIKEIKENAKSTRRN